MDQMIIGTVGIAFALMGIYGLVAPAALLAPFATQVTSVDGRNEVRAVYGGFGLAVALALALAAAAQAPVSATASVSRVGSR